MELRFYNFRNNTIDIITEPPPHSEWGDKLEWIDIRSENRAEVIEYLSFLKLSPPIIDIILHPEDVLLTEVDSNVIIQNFVISKEGVIYGLEHITLLIFKEFVISISPESVLTLINPERYEIVQDHFDDMRFFFAYILGNNIISVGTRNMVRIRKTLNDMKQLLISRPDELGSKDVVNLLFNISTFSDIVENQYVSLSSFTKLLVGDQRSEDAMKLQDVVNGIKELARITERLEDKADSLRSQFTMIHQEESTHKINILTIIQAIFVPMTFLAGLYGMNFSNMPELGWRYAYFGLIGIFGLMAIIQLIFFKRNGWFE
ncbi:MAG: hypothetical protein DRJ61_10035 [Acidobacteria bacterium]|nr:MAG: hypothetical protein DRJ61_10035 [Acidobacteriota bacterium]